MKLLSLEELSPRVGRSWIGKGMERLLGLNALNVGYANICAASPDKGFFQRCLEEFAIDYEILGDTELTGLTEGPAIVVANHPFGGIEAIVISHILLQLRPDTKIMANYLLLRMEEMRQWAIPVDPFGGEGSHRANIKPIREAIQHLGHGGVLLMFPSGEVSHWHLGQRKVTDPPWTKHLASLVKRSGAPIVPVHVHGRNSLIFQMAGLIHPRLRTALLPREVINKRGTKVRLTVGKPLSSRQLRRFDERERMIAFVRATTYLLQHAAPSPSQGDALTTNAMQDPIASPIPPNALTKEVAALSHSARLVAQAGFEVYVVRRADAPQVVEEIGRLRELTFREIGEGTGKARDLDRFDDIYEHLFLWCPATQEIVGAYRLTRVDEAIQASGVRGLYTATLFKFRPGFLHRLGDAIELGRSFIVARHQKQRHSLLLLWCGICAYVDRHPKYHTLFGPVSMSQDYTSISRQLLVWFIRKSYRHPILSRLVKATRPFKNREALAAERNSISHCLQSIDDVSALISGFESDGKGVPVLFKQYLKMNALLIGFNVDRDFSNVLDGLLIVDLRTAADRMLLKYFGADAFQRFRERHCQPTPNLQHRPND